MDITELIAKLNEMKEQFGNVPTYFTSDEVDGDLELYSVNSVFKSDYDDIVVMTSLFR